MEHDSCESPQLPGRVPGPAARTPGPPALGCRGACLFPPLAGVQPSVNVEVDWRGVRRGAVWALAVAVPVIVTVQVADAAVDVGEDSNWLFLPYLAVLVGLVTGGRLAARHRRDAPLTHGALAALMAYAAIAVVSTVLRLAAGKDPDPVALVFNGLMSASAGMFGGLLATRRGRPARRAHETPSG